MSKRMWHLDLESEEEEEEEQFTDDIEMLALAPHKARPSGSQREKRKRALLQSILGLSQMTSAQNALVRRLSESRSRTRRLIFREMLQIMSSAGAATLAAPAKPKIVITDKKKPSTRSEWTSDAWNSNQWGTWMGNEWNANEWNDNTWYGAWNSSWDAGWAATAAEGDPSTTTTTTTPAGHAASVPWIHPPAPASRTPWIPPSAALGALPKAASIAATAAAAAGAQSATTTPTDSAVAPVLPDARGGGYNKRRGSWAENEGQRQRRQREPWLCRVCGGMGYMGRSMGGCFLCNGVASSASGSNLC
jgi:hypothetical protein